MLKEASVKTLISLSGIRQDGYARGHYVILYPIFSIRANILMSKQEAKSQGTIPPLDFCFKIAHHLIVERCSSW